MNSEKVINPALEGKLIFAFQKIRNVALIELRNGFNHIPDLSCLFYAQRMEKAILQNNIDLKLYESVQKEAENFVIYELLYSVDTEKNIQKALENKYNYYLISYSDSIVSDYHQVRREFELRSESGNFCRIKDLDSLLSVYRKHLKILESGRLAA